MFHLMNIRFGLVCKTNTLEEVSFFLGPVLARLVATAKLDSVARGSGRLTILYKAVSLL